MGGVIFDQALDLLKTIGILGVAFAAGQLVRTVRELERRVGRVETMLEHQFSDNG